MLDGDGLPHIKLTFDESIDAHAPAINAQAIKRALAKMLPPDFFKQAHPDQHFPWIHNTLMKKVPSNIVFSFLMTSRPNAFKFFYEMISRWLVPGVRLNVILVYSVDFCMPEISHNLFNLCKVVIRVEDSKQLDTIQKNYPIIEAEIAVGLRSAYYAQRILEIKGLAGDEKTAFIQEQLGYVFERFPTVFDQTIFTEMQHVLMISSDDFKALRECRHLTRIICLHYLFRKELLEEIKNSPGARFQKLKVFKCKVGSKIVVGILIGVNFLRDKELFEQRHLMKAILVHLPSAKAVDNSFFSNRRGSEPLTTLYIEIEKVNGEPISGQELQLLRTDLPKDLDHHIENLLPQLFMPRNDEEIMRHIMSLSNQIKYIRDLPQIVISFDHQTHSSLYFTVILVRILGEDQRSLKEIFEQGATFFEYIHDNNRKVGLLRKKHVKEATVFRVKFSKDNFIRIDHSIDLSKARHAIVSEITRLVGPIRDFNGGMISQQTELLTALKALMKLEGIRCSEWLLENFFYSLSPPMMRAVLDPKSLKTLLSMMLIAMNQKEGKGGEGTLRINTRDDSVYVLIKTQNNGLKEDLDKVIAAMALPNLSQVSSSVRIQDINYLGYIFHSLDPSERDRFAQAIAAAAAPALSFSMGRESLPAINFTRS